MTERPEVMRQIAPWPTELEELIDAIRPQAGWKFVLTDRPRDAKTIAGGAVVVGSGLTLEIVHLHEDTYRPGRERTNVHLFAVPPNVLTRETWVAWLFDRVMDVMRHEAGETFIFDVDGGEWRPFAPSHGYGEDPYRVPRAVLSGDA